MLRHDSSLRMTLAVMLALVMGLALLWGQSPHPAASVAPGLSLTELRAEHPSPHILLRTLQTLGLGLPVRQASNAALVATIQGPNGCVQLR